MQKSDKYFNTDHLKKNLKGRSVRGLQAVFGGRGMVIVLETIGTMILARLLFPADYGLIAMVAVVVNFAVIFRDIGLSSATVWSEKLSQQLITNMFWISIGIGTVLTAIVATMAPAIAWFYNEPRLVGITFAMLPAFIFSSAMLQHQALLRRQMKFGRLALIRLVASTGGILSAVICAWNGMEYWSLVVQRVSSSILLAILTWSFCHWLPGMPRKCHDTGTFLRFGGNLSAGRLIQYLLRNADNIILGYYAGSYQLGIYSKAYALLMLPLRHVNEPFSSVVVPALSRIQSEPKRFRNYYIKALSVTAMISVPIAIFAAVASHDIIRVLLGEKWDESATIFLYLVPVAFLGSFNVASGWIYISLGYVKRQLRMQLVTGPLGLLAMLIGVRWGIKGMAIALSVVGIICWLPRMLYCYHGTPVSLKDLFVTLYRPIVSSLFAASIVFVVTKFLPPSDPGILPLIIKGMCFGFFYVVTFFLSPGGREVVLYYWKTIVIAHK